MARSCRAGWPDGPDNGRGTAFFEPSAPTGYTMHESTSLGTIGDGNSVTERTKHMGAGLRPADWEELLLVYMHDPVDKALDIRGHEKRAARYASRALGREVDRSEIKSSAALADQLAAIAERIPMPTAGADGERAVGLEHGRLEVRHPVSAASSTLEDLAVDEDAVLDAIDDIVHGLDSPRQRYLALWRLLPERLERRLGPAFVRQPADTRVPDHTLFHLPISPAVSGGSRTGGHGGAYLSLSLGPVQPFIAAARTVRDLWSGSAILSWLTFQGLMPVLERFGPTALVFPAPRGGPLMDLWLREHAGIGDRIALPSVPARCSPSIPNRFLALVPWGPDGRDGHAMAELCADAVHAAWLRLSEDVRARLDSALAALDPTWARRWREQAEQFFEVRASVVPERPSGRLDIWQAWSAVRTLSIRCGPTPPPFADWPRPSPRASDPATTRRRPAAGRHSSRSPRASRKRAPSATCRRAVRRCRLRRSAASSAPSNRWDRTDSRTAALLGRGQGETQRRWRPPARRRTILGCRVVQTLRGADDAGAGTRSRTARLPVPRHGDGRRGGLAPRCRHRTGRRSAPDGRLERPLASPDIARGGRGRRGAAAAGSLGPDRHRPKAKRRPAASLLRHTDDGRGTIWDDGSGGDLGPRVRDVLHPRMRDYYEGLGERARRGLDARRPVGPALHASISDALNNFAATSRRPWRAPMPER